MSGEPGSGDFAGQAGLGYRRGFVLGLTLAEAALLLVFIVMLLLVAGFERRDREIASLQIFQRTVAEVLPGGLQETPHLLEQVEKVRELQEVAEAAGHQWNDDFIELVRAVAATPLQEGLVDIVTALQEEQQRLQRVADQLGSGGAEIVDMATQLAAHEAAIANYRGQVVSLRERLARSGRGGDLPSCWMTPEGKIDYLLDVVLDPEGIRARESFPAYRQPERDRLPLPEIPAGSLYTPAHFLSTTRAVFDWSVANECRFYVVVYDGTGAHEKELYKSLLRTVEGHFYKREDRGAPVF